MLSRQAVHLREIDQAVRFNEPIGPDHPFYTDFSGVRGDFREKTVYRILNVDTGNGDFSFDADLNGFEKKLFFLGGMRGSGKTSELAKYAKNLHRPACFFVITCNIEDALDMNDVEYMDVLIFQLEQLTYELDQLNVRVDANILVKMKAWFQQRETEIKAVLKGELGFELGIGTDKPSMLSTLLGVLGNLKVGLQGSRERATTIRSSLKNRFSDFAAIFNQYIEEANLALRQQQLGQEILFIVDGLEKTMSAEMRRKLIIDESNRLQQIKAYTIFTLPIELMKERQKINQFSTVESFPYVKIVDRMGMPIETAFKVFESFVYKRIHPSLFEDTDVVREAIRLGGGSPRELLRLLEAAAFYADESSGKLDQDCLLRAARRLANQAAQYLTQEKLDKLREIHTDNLQGRPSPFDDLVGEMLEDIILMEYNDGSYKRVNPVVELSDLYQQRVLGAS
ncbi:MAG: hypothetical protein SF053_15580 [Bacteroidia bacterium]|nr:hypothetical protein [Bacteroidia bacterium]